MAAGARAGYVTTYGYRLISIAVGGVKKRYYAHRVIWRPINGKWPEAEIDHVNGDKDDNRRLNLRAATSSQNKANRRAKHGGLKGVGKHRGRWVADVGQRGNRRRLGSFATEEEAHAAYAAAARELHGECENRIAMTAEPSLVRPVKADNCDVLVDLLRLRHEEFGLGRFDPRRASDTLQIAIDASGSVIAGIIDGNGGPVATIGIALAQFWDEADAHLEALWDYVHPDHRTTSAENQTGHTTRLHRFAMLSADKLGVPLLMGSAMRAGSNGKIHAYCKNFRPAGAFFTYGGDGWKRPTKAPREAAQPL